MGGAAGATVVVGASEVGAVVVGARVVGAGVVGAGVVGARVVGAGVVGAGVVGTGVVGPGVVGAGVAPSYNLHDPPSIVEKESQVQRPFHAASFVHKYSQSPFVAFRLGRNHLFM